MIITPHILFWLFVALISILMLASNFLLAAALRLAVKKAIPSPCMIDSISVIIPAYNEELNIKAKIDTLWQALRTIDVQVEVLIGSDGSRDRTVEIAESRLKELDAVNWRVLKFENSGKCNTINKLAKMARGEIIISTDADIPLPEYAIELVVRAFQNNRKIGCLSCVPCFKGLDIGSQKSYWNIEDQIRSAESDLGKLIVVTGMLYAYRKELFEEIPEGVMADDLWIPLNVLLKGRDCIQLDELRVPYEQTNEIYEVQRRKRVIVGGMDTIRRLWPDLFHYPKLLLIVLFHKINRWALPLWMILFMTATIGIWPLLIIAYTAGVFAVFLLLGRDKFFTLFYSIFSPVLAFVEVMKGKDLGRWERIIKE